MTLLHVIALINIDEVGSPSPLDPKDVHRNNVFFYSKKYVRIITCLTRHVYFDMPLTTLSDIFKVLECL